jgi:hypothetical protein
MATVADHTAEEVLQPGEEPLDLPTTLVAAHRTAAAQLFASRKR